MIIFLYGKDGYRLKQNLDKIIGEYKKRHTNGMSFSVLDAGDGFDKLTAGGFTSTTLEKLEDLVKTVSFFNEKRLIVIKNSFLINKELAALIKKWELAEDKERIVVCVENQSEPELNKKDKGFCALLTAKPNLVKNFEPLGGRQLEDWAVKEVANSGKKIEPAAVKKLISYVGNDSWLLSHEIAKLINYKNSDGSETITIADVDLLVTPKIDLNIFEVVDAIANKNRLRAAKLLYNHLEAGVDPYYIFSMIVYQFRNLLRVRDLAKNAVPYAAIIKKTGLNPFVVKKTYDQCKQYELGELKEIFNYFSRIDVKTKSGQANLTDCLYDLVFSFTE